MSHGGAGDGGCDFAGVLALLLAGLMLAETFVPPPSPKLILPPDQGPLPPGGELYGYMPKQQWGATPSHIRQVVRPPIAFDANVGQDVQPLDRLPELLNQVQDFFPQVHMFNCTGRILPFMSTPLLCPAQHPIDHQQRVRANS